LRGSVFSSPFSFSESTQYGRQAHVEIRVRDNGTGIPVEIKDKIFNPFFTTNQPERALVLASQSATVSS
jgi:nitrogen-specific signal transduction histidine kinase